MIGVRNYRRGVLLLLVCTTLACRAGRNGPHGPVVAAPSGPFTAEQWRENVDFTAATLRENHPDPFAFSPEKEFEETRTRLLDSIPTLQDHERLAALASLVAGLHDGHTALRGGFSFLSGQFPLQFRVFSDGIFVTAAGSSRQDLIGSRLIAIDGVDADQAFARVSEMTPHDNEWTLLQRAPAFLSSPEALHATGVTRRRDRATFKLQSDQRLTRAIELAPVSFEERLFWSGDVPVDRRPLRRQRHRRNYWSRLIREDSILYVKFDRVRNDPDQPIAAFAAEQSRLERQKQPRCVVLDIRDNGGGNGYLNSPLVDWAAGSAAAENGSFFVAIGRGTFSAAQKLATSLERQTDAVFIGEPTGSRPNHFGDSESFSLPHGDLTLSVSSRYWEDAGPDDTRDTLAPSILVRESSTDFFGFTDPVLTEIQRRCR